MVSSRDAFPHREINSRVRKGQSIMDENEYEKFMTFLYNEYVRPGRSLFNINI